MRIDSQLTLDDSIVSFKMNISFSIGTLFARSNNVTHYNKMIFLAFPFHINSFILILLKSIIFFFCLSIPILPLSLLKLLQFYNKIVLVQIIACSCVNSFDLLVKINNKNDKYTNKMNTGDYLRE